MPELSIIIVNRNGRPVIARCLESLREAGRGRDWQTVVVDNASDDGSPDFIARSYPEAKLLRTGGNLGFSRANNLAWRRTESPFLLFLNPDTAVIGGAIDILLEEMRRRPRAGACGPRLIRDDGTFQVSFGRRVTFFRELARKSFLNAVRSRRLATLRGVRETDWVSGACLLARREALEQAGGFDEAFFLYFEDIDLCVRMGARGWKTYLVPAAKVLHLGGAATSRFAASRYEYRRSQLLYYDRHASAASRFLLRAYLRLNFLFLSAARRKGKGQAPGPPRLKDLLKTKGAKP